MGSNRRVAVTLLNVLVLYLLGYLSYGVTKRVLLEKDKSLAFKAEHASLAPRYSLKFNVQHTVLVDSKKQAQAKSVANLFSIFKLPHWKVNVEPYQDDIVAYAYPDEFFYTDLLEKGAAIKSIKADFISARGEEQRFLRFNFYVADRECCSLKITPSEILAFKETKNGRSVVLGSKKLDAPISGSLEVRLSDKGAEVRNQGHKVLSFAGLGVHNVKLSALANKGAVGWVNGLSVLLY